MTEVRLRNVDPGVVEAIREMAKQNRRSLEAEIKAGLARLASQAKAELLGRLRQERQRQKATLPDSTAEIRTEREKRW